MPASSPARDKVIHYFRNVLLLSHGELEADSFLGALYMAGFIIQEAPRPVARRAKRKPSALIGKSHTANLVNGK